MNQTANYGGLQAAVNANFWRNDLQAGVYGFGQHSTTTSATNSRMALFPQLPCSSIGVTGGLAGFFVNDKFKATSWLTLIAGLRQTHFTADIVENATDPRYGVAVKVPRLNWVFRAFYGDFYQAPPLVTATGALLDLATSQDFTFAPLHGERDKESSLVC